MRGIVIEPGAVTTECLVKRDINGERIMVRMNTVFRGRYAIVTNSVISLSRVTLRPNARQPSFPAISRRISLSSVDNMSPQRSNASP